MVSLSLWLLGIDILFSVNSADTSFALWCGFLYVSYYLVLKDAYPIIENAWCIFAYTQTTFDAEALFKYQCRAPKRIFLSSYQQLQSRDGSNILYNSKAFSKISQCKCILRKCSQNKRLQFYLIGKTFQKIVRQYLELNNSDFQIKFCFATYQWIKIFLKNSLISCTFVLKKTSKG